MYSHASNLDPFIIAAVQPLACKWVGKKDLFVMPLIGWMALALGYLPINRGNRDKAVQSLSEAGQRIKEYGRVIAISPEGTRSKIGQLADFKKGPFHLQEQTQVPVLPCTIQGAFELWPPGEPFPSSGQVTVKFLAPIMPDSARSREATAKAVRMAMLGALAEAPAGTGQVLSVPQWGLMQIKRAALVLGAFLFCQGLNMALARFTVMQLVKASVGITVAVSGAVAFSF